MTHVLVLAALAGLSALAGALLGVFEQIKPDWLTCKSRHAIMAFGGGALLAAVCLVLVPKGMAAAPLPFAAGAFLAGAGVFLVVDAWLQRQGSKFSQFMAMMLDFVPESLVLGAVITRHPREAVFLTVLIAAQNLPEAFNAFREMRDGDDGLSRRSALILIGLASASGLVWALAGFLLFAPDGLPLGLVMMFCGGGIFYLVFRDIAPDAQLEHYFLPSSGAVAGFMIGIVGHGLI